MCVVMQKMLKKISKSRFFISHDSKNHLFLIVGRRKNFRADKLLKLSSDLVYKELLFTIKRKLFQIISQKNHESNFLFVCCQTAFRLCPSQKAIFTL